MASLKEMQGSKFTVVIKEKESVVKSAFKDLVTFSFIAFCVYISQGSTWWTFVTGGLFLMFGLIKISSIIEKNTNVFDNADDACNYINKKLSE